MPSDIGATRATFRELHRTGCFMLPNAWDLGSLRRLERLGAVAVASTSAGLAWSLGVEDYQLSRDQVLDHLRALSAATDLPINADFENGFADRPDEVAANAVLAAETGIAGLSIEDRGRDGLYDIGLGADRIRAARAALDEDHAGMILVGRSEGFLVGDTDIGRTIERLVAYGEAGADCLYAPGVHEPDHIAAIVAAVGPKPVNVLPVRPHMDRTMLAALGARRISAGGWLARAAWTGFDAAAAGFVEEGALPKGLWG